MLPDKLTLEDVPAAILELNKKVDMILNRESVSKPEPDKLLTLDELREFLPEHPKRPTVYGWVNNRLIPYQKHGRKLYFKKSVIQSWLDKGRQS